MTEQELIEVIEFLNKDERNKLDGDPPGSITCSPKTLPGLGTIDPRKIDGLSPLKKYG